MVFMTTWLLEKNTTKPLLLFTVNMNTAEQWIVTAALVQAALIAVLLFVIKGGERKIQKGNR